MINAPVQIAQALDSDNRISSKWIAEVTGKKLKHINRDIHTMLKGTGPNLDRLRFTKNEQGLIVEIFMPLTFAIILLSRYRGPKSEQARELIKQALDYFLNRAPVLEAELAEAKRKLEETNKKQLRKPASKNKETWLVPIYAEPLFDDGLNQKVIVAYDRKRLDELNPKQAVIVQLEHVRAIMHGVQKKEQEIFEMLMNHEGIMQ